MSSFLKQLEDLYGKNNTCVRENLCGKLIDSGSTRFVYECKLHNGYVVKEEISQPCINNISEHIIWDCFKYAPWYAKWFSEVVFISSSGKYLVMKKLFVNTDNKFPKRVPYFFTDLKKKNFGYDGKLFKCCDYAFVIQKMSGLMTPKLINVKWR